MYADPETIALVKIASELHEFNCVTGDPRGYHTTPEGEMHRYTTLGFTGETIDAVCGALCAALQMLRADSSVKLTLYMRSPPTIERDPESNRWNVRMRLAAPGANWTNVTTKPEGAPFPRVDT